MTLINANPKGGRAHEQLPPTPTPTPAPAPAPAPAPSADLDKIVQNGPGTDTEVTKRLTVDVEVQLHKAASVKSKVDEVKLTEVMRGAIDQWVRGELVWDTKAKKLRPPAG